MPCGIFIGSSFVSAFVIVLKWSNIKKGLDTVRSATIMPYKFMGYYYEQNKASRITQIFPYANYNNYYNKSNS